MIPPAVEAAAQRFEELYGKRHGAYAKDASDERFLEELNEYLEPRERELYRDYEVEHPFVFVLGLPRSGTTLVSQVLAYCLDAGYVDNLAARFWLAPVHGIRLSQLVGGGARGASFESDYARTARLHDIHEFGYFWRHWLRKDGFDDVVHAREREGDIDWAGLRRALVNVQHELGRPFVAKNMLGAYHMPKLREVLEQVVYVLIERDPLDVAVSILDARRKYYADPNTWWSYVPVEFPRLKDLDFWEQIGGQVHYLTRFYRRALDEVGPEAVVRVSYEELCARPGSVLDAVEERVASTYGYRIGRRLAPPESFPFRVHDDRAAEKERFAAILERLQADAP